MLPGDDVGAGVPGPAAVGGGEDGVLGEDGAAAEVEVAAGLPAHLESK